MKSEVATVSLRIGVLGAASITKSALIKPANDVPGVTVAALAARSRDRAEAYAQKNGIPRVYDSYESLLASPDIDAVYIPTPPALHAPWALAAIAQGKHVLVEKPFAANAADAQRVADAAKDSPVIVMEAFHPLYHPVSDCVRSLLSDKTIGQVTSVFGSFCAPIPPGKNIRWKVELGGGSLMDLGCYPLRVQQDLFGAPERVVSAQAGDRQGIDRYMKAQYLLPDGVEGTIHCSMWSRTLLAQRMIITGTEGTIRVSMPFTPQLGAKVRVETPSGKRRYRVSRTPSYTYQLRAFQKSIEEGHQPLSPVSESVIMMNTIDATYAAAGMQPRPTSD